jgi:hypothetical protein
MAAAAGMEERGPCSAQSLLGFLHASGLAGCFGEAASLHVRSRLDEALLQLLSYLQSHRTRVFLILIVGYLWIELVWVAVRFVLALLSLTAAERRQDGMICRRSLRIHRRGKLWSLGFTISPCR